MLVAGREDTEPAAASIIVVTVDDSGFGMSVCVPVSVCRYRSEWEIKVEVARKDSSDSSPLADGQICPIRDKTNFWKFLKHFL